MRPLLSTLLEAILLLLFSIIWCELGYYYFIFHYNCSGWPGPDDGINNNSNNLTRILVIADTHIMGPIKSVRIDKIRREWQMQQAFSISNEIYKPSVVLFLGDILDEGSFSLDRYFEEACDDFDRIFAHNQDKQMRIIIPGNHDIGFHDQMIFYPHLLNRFRNRYKIISSVELVRDSKLTGLNVISINSMTFYNDKCPACLQSIGATNRLAKHLDNIQSNSPNHYSSPIILTHIPLYRPNDFTCAYPSSMYQRIAKGNKEGEDVLHRSSSDFLLAKLRPKLVLSGHTHMQCYTEHKIASDGHDGDPVSEITLSSYNHKYAELKPGFLLLAANRTHVYTRHCDLVEEWIIISVYTTTLLIIITRLMLMLKNDLGNRN